VTRLLAGYIGVRPGRDVEFFLFVTSSRPVLGPTQIPIQREPEAPSPWVNRPGRGGDYSIPLVAKLRMCGATPSLPNTCLWPGTWLSAGRTSPLYNYKFLVPDGLKQWKKWRVMNSSQKSILFVHSYLVSENMNQNLSLTNLYRKYEQ
jgi:hypothetical protein